MGVTKGARGGALGFGFVEFGFRFSFGCFGSFVVLAWGLGYRKDRAMDDIPKVEFSRDQLHCE